MPSACFYPFLEDASVQMLGVEAGGEGIIPEKHAARFQGGSLGVLQGTRSYILQDENGQIQLTHSVSAGLDYAAVGPEHAWLRDQRRVEYGYATDDQALAAFIKLARLEGIIPALESAHAIAAVIERAPKMPKDQLIIVNLSGRGDKDVAQVAAKIKLDAERHFPAGFSLLRRGRGGGGLGRPAGRGRGGTRAHARAGGGTAGVACFSAQAGRQASPGAQRQVDYCAGHGGDAAAPGHSPLGGGNPCGAGGRADAVESPDRGPRLWRSQLLRGQQRQWLYPSANR